MIYVSCDGSALFVFINVWLETEPVHFTAASAVALESHKSENLENYGFFNVFTVAHFKTYWAIWGERNYALCPVWRAKRSLTTKSAYIVRK